MRHRLRNSVWPIRIVGLIALSGFVLWLAACSAPPAAPTPGAPTDTPAAAPPTLSPTAAAYPSLEAPTPDSEQAYPPPPLTPTPAAAYPAPSPAPAAAPLTGLVYSNKEGVWLIEGAARQRQLSLRPGAVIAPDLSQAVYFEGDDVWRQELSSGQTRVALTFAPDRAACCVLLWWAAQPDWLLTASHPSDDVTPDLGSLLFVNLTDGRQIAPSPASLAFGAPALSPDGRTLAFDEGGAPALFQFPAGPVERLEPGAFTLPDGQPLTVLGMGSPAWSPDGTRLAWYMTFSDAGVNAAAILVLDLTTSTAQRLHSYVNLGRGGWFSAPRWSPDGRWLALVAEAEQAAERGVWVAAADGSAEFQLGPGFNPVWRPDSQYLIYSQDNDTHWLVTVGGEWPAVQVTLPNSQLQTWLSAQP